MHYIIANVVVLLELYWVRVLFLFTIEVIQHFNLHVWLELLLEVTIEWVYFDGSLILNKVWKTMLPTIFLIYYPLTAGLCGGSALWNVWP